MNATETKARRVLRYGVYRPDGAFVAKFGFKEREQAKVLANQLTLVAISQGVDVAWAKHYVQPFHETI